MIDQNRPKIQVEILDSDLDPSEILFDTRPFTRSNGTILARLYERLTKRSRRSNNDAAYRQGIYDAYKALQEELR